MRYDNQRSLLHKLPAEVHSQLFSASALVETRAAAQLSENVRLLAYVSIFYLPLAFCTVSCTYTLASVLLLTWAKWLLLVVEHQPYSKSVDLRLRCGCSGQCYLFSCLQPAGPRVACPSAV